MRHRLPRRCHRRRVVGVVVRDAVATGALSARTDVWSPTPWRGYRPGGVTGGGGAGGEGTQPGANMGDIGRIMQQTGMSAADAQKAMLAMAKSIEGGTKTIEDEVIRITRGQ